MVLSLGEGAFHRLDASLKAWGMAVFIFSPFPFPFLFFSLSCCHDLHGALLGWTRAILRIWEAFVITIYPTHLSAESILREGGQRAAQNLPL